MHDFCRDDVVLTDESLKGYTSFGARGHMQLNYSLFNFDFDFYLRVDDDGLLCYHVCAFPYFHIMQSFNVCLFSCVSLLLQCVYYLFYQYVHSHISYWILPCPNKTIIMLRMYLLN